MRIQTDKKFIEIKIKNARELSVVHNYEVVDIIKKNDLIDEINFHDYKINVGEEVKVTFNERDYYYKISKIIMKNHFSFTVIEGKINKCNRFLMSFSIGVSFYKNASA